MLRGLPGSWTMFDAISARALSALYVDRQSVVAAGEEGAVFHLMR